MTIVARHQELSDDQVESASLDELRAAYRALREHHIAETTALISRRDDLTRRRDEQLAKDQEVLGQSQKLLERADQIMRGDAETIDRLGAENAQLSVELLERRAAETIFVEIDRQFQEVDCRTCDDAGADNCEKHKLLVRQWRSARAALCDLARLHRGYLLSLNAPSGGDPR